MSNSHQITRVNGPFVPVWPRSRYLWRLIPTAKIAKLDTFLRGGIWFARLDTFNSNVPEGTLPRPNINLLSKLPKFQIPMIKKIYRKAVRRSFASCWHMNDSDPSDDIWDSFGDGGNGVAIRTTPQVLYDALSGIRGQDGPLHFGEIRYIDHWLDVIPEANVIEAAFVVEDGYRHEQEARLLLHTHGTAAADNLANTAGLLGPLVKRPPQRQLDAGSFGFLGGTARGKAIVPSVNQHTLIQEIVIGKNVANPQRKLVVDSITHAGLGSRIRP